MSINSSDLDRFDSHKMYKIYDEWPDIAEKSDFTELGQVNFDNIKHLVFAGMGGSGALHDIFAAILSKTDIHVSSVKGYHLPSTINSDTLVVTTSVSGNTVETLTVLDSSRQSKCKIIAFSSGGKMQDYCSRYRIEHRNIPMYLNPRSSFTSYLFSMIRVLEPVIPIRKQDVLESINELKRYKKNISSDNLSNHNPAIDLANWISDIPMIYYPWGLQAAAVRFKNSLQENAKIHAMMEDIIETSHNGIVAWEREPRIKPILIRGHDDYIKTKERWNIIKEYFDHKGIEYKEIFSTDGGILEKTVSLIYLLDYSSIYLSVISGINPNPVIGIDFIKNKTTNINYDQQLE